MSKSGFDLKMESRRKVRGMYNDNESIPALSRLLEDEVYDNTEIDDYHCMKEQLVADKFYGGDGGSQNDCIKRRLYFVKERVLSTIHIRSNIHINDTICILCVFEIRGSSMSIVTISNHQLNNG